MFIFEMSDNPGNILYFYDIQGKGDFQHPERSERNRASQFHGLDGEIR